jgi:type IV secretory pathway VirB4 component
VRESVWTALQSLAAAPRDQRTLTMLAATIQDRGLKAALAPFTLSGPHGRLLDACVDTLASADWQTFEMGELMASRAAAGPVLTYLFHTLARQFDGRPTLLVLDEAWLLLESTTFAAKIREWLLTLRKLNVAVVFATPSLKAVLDSSIAAALLEGCPTRLFLPNPDARTWELAKAYAAFGLNDQQIAMIAGASAKREYYYQSASGQPPVRAGIGSRRPGGRRLGLARRPGLDQPAPGRARRGWVRGRLLPRQGPARSRRVPDRGAPCGLTRRLACLAACPAHGPPVRAAGAWRSSSCWRPAR